MTSLPTATGSARAGKERWLGPVSLGVATAGAVACHVAIGTGVLHGTWLQVVRSGFEAAMVGGLADWFAVTALFRHPLGIPIPHTAIIASRRHKLVDGAVTIVQEEWLSPEVIGARVLRAHPAAALHGWLSEPARVRALEPTLRTLLSGLAAALTQHEVVVGVDRVMRQQLKRYPIDSTSGQWLDRLAGSDGAVQAFEALARSFSRVALQPHTARRMHEWLEHTARHLEEDGKRLVPMLLRSNTVRRKVVEAACHYAANELEHAAREVDHPLRVSAFEALQRYAGRLQSSEAEALTQLERLRRLLLENLSPDPLSAQPLAELQRQLQTELERPDSPLLAHATEHLRLLGLRMLATEGAPAAFDAWVRHNAIELVARYHHQIGLTIRESLESLPTDALVAQVEERLGPDLQYIRLNGALVGGVIGLVMALVRLAIG